MEKNINDKTSKGANPLRTYPASSFGDCLELGEAIYVHSTGARIRRLTLMEKLGRSPTGGSTRQLFTNSAKYGITKGSYNTDWIELTPAGKLVVDDTQPNRDRLAAKFTLAIDQISPFKKLYEEYVKRRLPAVEVMRDFLIESGEELSDYQECIDIFTVNVKYVGLLRTIGGIETLVPIDQVVDDLPSEVVGLASLGKQRRGSSDSVAAQQPEVAPDDWDKICFYITPIGDDDSEQRKPADLFCGSLVEPAMAEVGLRLVRADRIGQPGMITSQIMEHVKRCKLVAVDLSYLNPNVFYEMALRHACKLPVVHIIRKVDRIPFDVNQSRCIVVDTTDIYTLIPKLQVYKSEIATQARKALDDPEHCGNPVTVFYPDFFD